MAAGMYYSTSLLFGSARRKSLGGEAREKRTRAPKRKREEGERREFQVVHIARAGKRAMERMAGLPTGDG